MKSYALRFLCLFPVLFFGANTRISAAVEPAFVFTDHMVLQRGVLHPVWGRDAPGQRVAVSIAGQRVTTTTDSAGEWRVDLQPLEAGESRELLIEGSSSVRLKNVAVGEVWFASGQSNMQMSFGWIYNNAQIAELENSRVRFFQVPNKASREPANIEAAWGPAVLPKLHSYSLVGHFFARELNEALDVPIGIINASWGGMRAKSFTPRAALDAHPRFRTMSETWDAGVEWDPAVLAEAEDVRRPDSPHTPGILFQSMVEPFGDFPIRGVIWYQGESDAWSPAEEYREIFTLLISEWRRLWGREDLPFLFVQLPNFQPNDPSGVRWAELRQAQADALALPHTGMVVTIDVGDPKDIHPRNKAPVGERLALLAESMVYGRDVVATGPSPTEVRSSRGTIGIRFDAADGLKTKDGKPPAPFEVAGKDGRFHEAEAVLKGDVILVSAPGVKDPVTVRYAWRNDPQPSPNLVNDAGLPAAPFSLDAP